MSSQKKESVKWLEVPIEKFNAAALHFVELLKTHHKNIAKLKRLNQIEEINKELNSASRIVKQLTTLMDEIDNLRKQVIDSDLSKFDKQISNTKQIALLTIKTNREISNRMALVNSSQDKDCYSNFNAEIDHEKQEQQLRVIANLSEEIKIQEQSAASLDQIQEDIQDINCMFEQLSQLVDVQGETVEQIENNVETTHYNVLEGEKQLKQAARYKKGLYPLLGALMGSIVGGPVGFVAGLKLGSLTAVGCGFLGFTGGRFLKNNG